MMKTTNEIKEKKIPDIRINPELDKYDGVILFPHKFAKAKEKLKKSGFPKLSSEK